MGTLKNYLVITDDGLEEVSAYFDISGLSADQLAAGVSTHSHTLHYQNLAQNQKVNIFNDAAMGTISPERKRQR